MQHIEFWKEKAKLFVKDSRFELSLKQKELAEKLGVPQGNISKYETGQVSPPGHIILAIQDLLKEKKRDKILKNKELIESIRAEKEVDELFEMLDTSEWNEALEYLAQN